MEFLFGTEGWETERAGHEPNGPFVDAEEEDAVVEAMVVVCDQGVDVRVVGFWREEDLEWDVRVHYYQVAVKPAVVKVIVRNTVLR